MQKTAGECLPRTLSATLTRVEKGISMGASSQSKVSGLPCEPRDIPAGCWIWTYTALRIAPGKWEIPAFSAELGRLEAILTQTFGFTFCIALRGK